MWLDDWESRPRELDDRIGVLSAQIPRWTPNWSVSSPSTTRSGMAGPGWRSFAHYLSVRTNFAP